MNLLLLQILYYLFSLVLRHSLTEFLSQQFPNQSHQFHYQTRWKLQTKKSTKFVYLLRVIDLRILERIFNQRKYVTLRFLLLPEIIVSFNRSLEFIRGNFKVLLATRQRTSLQSLKQIRHFVKTDLQGVMGYVLSKCVFDDL